MRFVLYYTRVELFLKQGKNSSIPRLTV